jgi:hypothetical protein
MRVSRSHREAPATAPGFSFSGYYFGGTEVSLGEFYGKRLERYCKLQSTQH